MQARRLDGGAERSPRVAVVAALPVRLAADEVLGNLVGRGEPARAQEPRHRGGDHHLAPGGVRLQVLGRALPGELLADAEEARLEVHVTPPEPQRLADCA